MAAPQMPARYYSRFDPAKKYDQHLFRSGFVLQGAEMNEIQLEQHARIKSISDALFKDGDIVRDCQIIVDATLGSVHCASGAIYADGMVRGVEPRTFAVPMTGSVQIGVWVKRSVVDELIDPDLRDPASEMRNYQRPGAARLKVELTWGLSTSGDGDFFHVYDIDDGILRAKTPPPALDAISMALARYDRDSAGGHYIVRGLSVRQEEDDGAGNQVYTMSEGECRVNGNALEFGASRRIAFDAQPDLLWIDSEPHVSAGEAEQTIFTDRKPFAGTPEVRITARRTVNVVHGAFAGVADPLPDTSVISVESISQGATTYVSGTSWTLNAGQIDWSPDGPEPAPGTTYEVTYQYFKMVVPTGVTGTSLKVTGALAGTLVLVSYNQALRRIDRLCVDQSGVLSWVRGVSSPWTPVAPRIPSGRLGIFSVFQTWDAGRRLVEDGIRMVPMQTLSDYRTVLDSILEDQAEIRLAVDVAGRYSGIKKGLFADPFMSNEMRDFGLAQSALIGLNSLRLPFTYTITQLGAGITTRQSLPHAQKAILSQPAKTTTMLVNPYMAFDPIPRDVVLDPAVDRWTVVSETWATPVTRSFIGGVDRVDVSARTLSEKTSDIGELRSIPVHFRLDFGPGETLVSAKFDGLPVACTAVGGGALQPADSTGALVGQFTVPAGISSGSKLVEFEGSGGSHGVATFTGQGTLIQRELQQVTTIYRRDNADPLAQTFSVAASRQLTGVRLWFSALGGTRVYVQLREVDNGIPTARVIAEATLKASDISLSGPTDCTWEPVYLEKDVEYAFVVLCDDAVTAVHVAEIGKWDTTSLRWVTSQPYQIGVLLSSSNASTWTAHQDRDMTFELLGPNYTANERVIPLGTVSLTDCTDYMVQGFAHTPAIDSEFVFRVTVGGLPAVDVAPGQAVSLADRFTGTATVSAVLRGNPEIGPVMEPGVLFVAASIQTSGTYISPMFKAENPSTLRIVFEADLPSGSNVDVHYSADVDGLSWTPVPLESSTPYEGVVEFTHELSGISATQVRVRLTVTGTHLARPRIMNLRCVSM